MMLTKKHALLIGVNGALLIGLGTAWWGQQQNFSQAQAQLQAVQAQLSQAEAETSRLSQELAQAQADKEALTLDKYELQFQAKMGDQKVVVGKVFANGYLKKHGNHYHFVYGQPPVDAIYEDGAQAGGGHSTATDDHYVFNPADVVEENAEGYVVRHGDHYHFIYKRDVATGRPHVATTHEEEEPFVFNRSNIISEDANGYVVRHGDHTHYVYKRDLAHAPVVPNPASTSPVAQPGGCRLVRIPHGDHYHDFLDCGEGTPAPSFDDAPTGPVATPTLPDSPALVPDETHQPATPSQPQAHQPSDSTQPDASTPTLTLQSPAIQPYLDYISYAYGVDRDSIKLQAVYDDQGVYRGQVFAFQNMEQGQDKTHIHPWVVPLWSLELPSQDPAIDPELRFARELAGLAKRMGIPRNTIRILGDRFEIPHGDHSHTLRIQNIEGVQPYLAHKLAPLAPVHVPGDLDAATVRRYSDSLRALARQRLAGQDLVLARVEDGLQDIEESLSNKGNSTQGFIQLLDRFARRYILQTEASEPALNDHATRLNTQHAALMQAIGQLQLTDYALTADQLRDQANQAIEAGDAAALDRLQATVTALKAANDRPGVEAVKYLYFLTQHVQDQALSYEVREQVAQVIHQLAHSSAVFGGEDPVEPLFGPAIAAKQAIIQAHAQFQGAVDRRVGPHYQALTAPGQEGGPSVLADNKAFAAEVLEEADKDQSLPVSDFQAPVADTVTVEEASGATTGEMATAEPASSVTATEAPASHQGQMEGARPEMEDAAAEPEATSSEAEDDATDFEATTEEGDTPDATSSPTKQAKKRAQANTRVTAPARDTEVTRP